MRLRTEMVDGELLAYDRIIDPYAPSVVQVEYLKDDAMAAHALEDAKNIMGEEFAAKGVHGIVAVAVLAELDRRAAEILAGWMGEDRKS